MSETPKMIAADTLCNLTGLTDRRHRQLAEQGFFPAPIRSQYVLTATLQGLFRYYREARNVDREKKAQIDHEKHRKLKIENDRREEKLIERTKVAESIRGIGPEIRKEWEQKLLNEYPAHVAGLNDPAAVRIYSRRLLDGVWQRWTQLADQWLT